jgi:serine/threonine protein kinase
MRCSAARAHFGVTPVESVNAVLKEEPPDPSAAKAHVPLTLERILRRCLEKQPERRFQSTIDLAFAMDGEISKAISNVTPLRFVP